MQAFGSLGVCDYRKTLYVLRHHFVHSDPTQRIPCVSMTQRCMLGDLRRPYLSPIRRFRSSLGTDFASLVLLVQPIDGQTLRVEAQTEITSTIRGTREQLSRESTFLSNCSKLYFFDLLYS